MSKQSVFLEKQQVEEVCIIGGGVVFADTIDSVDQIYLTRVHTTLENGEVFFPELNAKKWQLVWEEFHPQDENHNYSFSFLHYKKKNLIIVFLIFCYTILQISNAG